MTFKNSLKSETTFQCSYKRIIQLSCYRIYEAAVKSVEYHLTRIIGETTLTFEEYGTIRCQVDPTDLNPLSSGHFLIGGSLKRIPDERDYKEIPINRLSRWEYLQKITQHFWERWHNEYLGTLINRSKWLNQQRNAKVGDLVVTKAKTRRACPKLKPINRGVRMTLREPTAQLPLDECEKSLEIPRKN